MQRFAYATGYDRYAALQRVVGARLLRCLPPQPGSCILDVGVGTGFILRQMLGRYPWIQAAGCDLAPPMLAAARQTMAKARLFHADASQDALGGPYDLIISNLTVQWFVDMEAGLTHLARHLKPGGVLLFSTLLSGSLQPWAACAARHRLPSPLLPFLSMAAYRQRVAPLGRVWTQEIPLRWAYDGWAGFFDCLRGLGAGGSRVPVPVSLLRQLIRAPRQQLIMPYHVGIVCVRR